MVMEARHNREFGHMLNEFTVVAPDGKPLTWLGRSCGFDLSRRVYGPELMETFCKVTATKGYRHYFYGGAEGVAEKLTEVMCGRYPGLQVAGCCSPPFRELTRLEDDAMVTAINASGAEVLWVGLGCPKQERWIFNHRDRLRVPIIAGVGQAFDIHAGTTVQAPEWMRENGLEWLFRLAIEPRRLWRRYLIYNTGFLWLVLLHWLGIRKSEDV
jgi:N-acetylglucosaminyldiphosphoundecaprenol N-acetyl-beta-D-mannosaminyltransferase